MDYQLAIFDLAGTTVKDNKDVHRVLQMTLRNHGVDITIEQANAVMGIPKPVAIRELLLGTGNETSPDAVIETMHQEFIAAMINFYKNDASVGEKHGVSETFQRLKDRGIKVAVNTGFDRKITDALLERIGWRRDNLIDYSVTSDEVVRGRPYPDMILKLMAQARVWNGNCDRQCRRLVFERCSRINGVLWSHRWCGGCNNGI